MLPSETSSPHGRRLHGGWLSVAAILIAGAPTWFWLLDSALDPQPPSEFEGRPAAAVLPEAALRFLTNQELFRELGSARVKSVDPVGAATDLKSVFEEYVRNPDPRERRKAVRAFQACVPMILSVSGALASPDRLITALPFENRVEREAAYRSLFTRCEGFLVEGRAALVATAEALRGDKESRPPGEIAKEALASGLDRIEPMVQDALNGGDPAALASLSGLSERIARLRDPRGADTAMLRRARETDTALLWIGCDLGLECGEQSLSALQLCTTEGLCEGDVQARLSARSSPDRVDSGDTQKERTRLLRSIRSGRTLTTADLLGRP